MAEEKRWKKIAMIIFLVLIVVGFTIPGFLNNNPDDQAAAEPRLCQSDADCYLLCADAPVTVLCSQNLCQQNSCTETSLYRFEGTPITFTLWVEVEGREVNLSERLDIQNLFVALSTDTALKIYSSRLDLGTIMEKFNLVLNERCITVGTTAYCETPEKNLTFWINGERSYQFERYYPQEGDVVEIKYGQP